MIYFIQGTQTGNIKIGHTLGWRVDERLKALQACSPDKLIVLKTIEGKPADETLIHRKFAASWSHAEWFKPTPDLLKFIEDLPVSESNGLSISISRPWSRTKRIKLIDVTAS